MLSCLQFIILLSFYRVNPAIAIVRKLIAVLESVEKLSVYNYDLPGSGYGLQVRIGTSQRHVVSRIMKFYHQLVSMGAFVLQILTRRLRFRLERAPGEAGLLDRSGCNLKMEPLTTVGALERYLLKMVWVLPFFAENLCRYDYCLYLKKKCLKT